jgi:hypothetical protein
VDDGCVVYQSINGGNRHDTVIEQLVPALERLVGGDHKAVSFVPVSNELEQHAGLALGEAGKCSVSLSVLRPDRRKHTLAGLGQMTKITQPTVEFCSTFSGASNLPVVEPAQADTQSVDLRN